MRKKIKFVSHDKSEFFAVLRRRVDQYFQENQRSTKGNERMIVKTIVMMSLYFVPYALIMSGALSLWACWALAVLMGIGVAGIGLSIMHDANHGSLSDRNWINNVLGFSLNVVGGNAFTWKLQHNVLHHTYTNIYEHDDDLDAGKVVRLSPHAPYHSFHRYQHWYAFPLYGLVTLSWVVMKDFLKIVRYNKMGLVRKNFAGEVAIIVATKLFYVFYMIVLPIVVLDLTAAQFLIGFLSLHLTAGVILSTVFQVAHVIEDTQHPMPAPDGTVENQWAVHQLVTTANFARSNRLLSWYVGGLNYQVEHHLFPNICHVHYRDLSEIVKQTAEEFDLPYLDQPTFGSALRSHARLLKEYGKPPVKSGRVEEPMAVSA
ncbi:MAG: acyl-CoA desaturase [Catalinimonas sp.]